MRLEVDALLSGLRVVDRQAVRGRIGEPSNRVTGWTRGRTVADFDVDGSIISLTIGDDHRDRLIAALRDGRTLVKVTIEFTESNQ